MDGFSFTPRLEGAAAFRTAFHGSYRILLSLSFEGSIICNPQSTATNDFFFPSQALNDRGVRKLVCTLEQSEIEYRFDAFRKRELEVVPLPFADGSEPLAETVLGFLGLVREAMTEKVGVCPGTMTGIIGGVFWVWSGKR